MHSLIDIAIPCKVTLPHNELAQLIYCGYNFGFIYTRTLVKINFQKFYNFLQKVKHNLYATGANGYKQCGVLPAANSYDSFRLVKRTWAEHESIVQITSTDARTFLLTGTKQKQIFFFKTRNRLLSSLRNVE